MKIHSSPVECTSVLVLVTGLLCILHMVGRPGRTARGHAARGTPESQAKRFGFIHVSESSEVFDQGSDKIGAKTWKVSGECK